MEFLEFKCITGSF